MMWQVASGSSFHKDDEAIPYSHYLQKARGCVGIQTNDKHIKEQQGYYTEISRVNIKKI